MAVPADGGWKISPVATYFDWIGIIQKEIAGLDADLFSALTQLDFSGIAQREPAATIDPDGEVVVDVEPVSSVIYGGIAVLEPTPTGYLVDYSCTADTPPGFCEIIVVDADGKRQERRLDFDPDYDYVSQFGFEVTAGTRVIVVAVAGKVTVQSESA